jgi:hypothetical protein
MYFIIYFIDFMASTPFSLAMVGGPGKAMTK